VHGPGGVTPRWTRFSAVEEDITGDGMRELDEVPEGWDEFDDFMDYLDSPWLDGVADVAGTLEILEIVHSPIPPGLFDALVPALTHLKVFRVDTGFVPGSYNPVFFS
jgi:hypothetical protein